MLMKRTIDCARRLLHAEPNVEVILQSTTISCQTANFLFGKASRVLPWTFIVHRQTVLRVVGDTEFNPVGIDANQHNQGSGWDKWSERFAHRTDH